MSAETTTNASDSKKKSFLTRLAENVAAKKNANETDENVIHLPDEAAAKRALKTVGAVLVGATAFGTAAYVIAKTVLKNMDSVDEDETEENDSED